MRVNSLDLEGDGCATVFWRCWADDTKAFDRRKLLQAIGSEILLMSVDILYANVLQQLRRCTKANDLACHLGVCFKALLLCRKRRRLHDGLFDHRTTGKKRW